MPARVDYDFVACGAGIEIVGPLFSPVSYCGSLSLVAEVVVVVVYEPSASVLRENISGIEARCARQCSTRFFSNLIRLGSMVH